MTYFTPELFIRLQSDQEEVLEAAEIDWEEASTRYRTRLSQVRDELPDSVRELVEGHFLHDAEILGIGAEEDRFVIAVRTREPEDELLVLVYELIEPATIAREVLPESLRSDTMHWLHDEIEVRANEMEFNHKIMFSNGWLVDLRFRSLEVVSTKPLTIPGPWSRPTPSTARTA